MTMPERPSYGEFRDKLTPDDVKGKPTVLTVDRAELRNLAPEGSRREDKKIVLTFKEFPARGDKEGERAKEYIANATSYKTLVQKLGEDYTRWGGKVVVMAPTTNTFEGKAFEKIHVAPPERWDKVLAEVARRQASKK